MLKLSEAERKTLMAWAIAAIIIFIIVLFIQINPNNRDEDETITTPGTSFINDRNRYYTVKNAIMKYYTFVNTKDYDSVIKILDSNYVKENKITKNNITDYISNEDIQLSYTTGIMCLKGVKDGVYIYTVEGDEISMNSGSILRKKYYEIVMDGNTSLFSVKPINENDYKEVCNG